MNDASLDTILTELQGSEAGPIVNALRGLEGRLAGLGAADLRRAVEVLCDLFYIDLADRPDMQPALERAEEALVAAGAPVVPILISMMEGSDIKSHLHLAGVLGRIGVPALPALRRMIATAEDPYSRSFALYAVGKIRSPEVHEALPEVEGALMHPDKEVRDSAARTLGKIAEAVAPEALTERRRGEIYEALCRALGDAQPAVRAKAVRSLGKMTARGYLSAARRADLAARLEAMMTRGEETDWDHAFIVRRQAREALAHLRTGEKGRHAG